MTNLNLTNLFRDAQSEEALKNYFTHHFNLKPDIQDDIDLYTPQILFEFKLETNIQNLIPRAKCFAQAMYYARQLKFGLNGESRPPTNFICVVTKNFAAILPTEIFTDYFTDQKIFDWNLSPSTPCKKLIEALKNFQPLRDCIVYDFSDALSENIFIDRINSLKKSTLPPSSKIIIAENNFHTVFDSWQKKFGAVISDENRKLSEYFITDIEAGKSQLIGNKIIQFQLNDGSRVEKNNFPQIKYAGFWSNYEKISDADQIKAIRQKMDRMTKEDLRRRTGEFYTPIPFAKVAIEYLSRTIDIDWRSGNFRLWDMAAGSGNLEDQLPAEALPFCYISTLNPDDAAYCQKIYPDATCFQYDYLNDDVDFLANSCATGSLKMPQNLAADLQNPKLKWIIFINPPYATASSFERAKNRQDKLEVSFTEIQKLMTAEGMGAASRELFAQFLYRISIEFKNRKAWLGIFSKIKYINSHNDQKLRDNFFQYKFENGFVFNSKSFQGCKGKFPVGFLIWNLAENIPLELQQIQLDIFNEGVKKIGYKIIYPARTEEFLTKWVKRPPNTKIFPPMSSALNIAYNNKIRCDKIPENFLAGLMCWNDFLHQNYTALLSGPYGTAGGMAITPENFEQYMVVHAVHLIPKATWLNDRDQFMQPTKTLPAEFISDAVVWSLFAASNQTASLRDVLYEGKIYQMPNNLYPWLLSEIKTWRLPEKFSEQLSAAQDRYAALWLKSHAAEISSEAAAVLSAGKEVYQKFYAYFELLVDAARWKITDWDAGWYQVRMSLEKLDNLPAAFKVLSEKLLPQIYELGFLRDEVEYFEEDFDEQ